MKKLNIFTVFVTIVALAALTISPTMALEDPVVTADSALLVEKDTGTILYQKNRNKQVDPGGTAKVMTLLLALEDIDKEQVSLQDSVTPSETFLEGIQESDDILGIEPGETILLEDLIYGAYLGAGNDACNIIAEYLAGDVGAFVTRMNQKARQLGCDMTHFLNPGGLFEEGQYTTAWDQYLILKAAVSYPMFTKIAGSSRYETQPTEVSREREFTNNNLLLDIGGDYYCRYCVAGFDEYKSGRGSELLTFADNNDDLGLISVLFWMPGEEGVLETTREDTFSTAVQLLDWGFNGFEWQIVLDEHQIITHRRVDMAEGSGDVYLRPFRTIEVLTRKDLMEDDIAHTIVIYADRSGEELAPPINEGTILGEVTVLVDGVSRGKTQLIAARDVGLNKTQYIKQQVFTTLSMRWVQVGISALSTIMLGYFFFVLRDVKRRNMKRRAIEAHKRQLTGEQSSPSNHLKY